MIILHIFNINGRHHGIPTNYLRWWLDFSNFITIFLFNIVSPPCYSTSQYFLSIVKVTSYIFFSLVSFVLIFLWLNHYWIIQLSVNPCWAEFKRTNNFIWNIQQFNTLTWMLQWTAKLLLRVFKVNNLSIRFECSLFFSFKNLLI